MTAAFFAFGYEVQLVHACSTMQRVDVKTESPHKVEGKREGEEASRPT